MVISPEIKKHASRFGATSGMTVADFGAGIGDYALYLAEKVAPTGKVYAVDIHKEALERLLRNAEDAGLGKVVRIVHGDLLLPRGSSLPDNSVDMVVITDVLYQAEDKKAPFIEAFRVLVPGGVLAFIDRKNGEHPVRLQEDLLVVPEAALCFATEAGFSEGKEIETDSMHYGYLFLKPYVGI